MGRVEAWLSALATRHGPALAGILAGALVFITPLAIMAWRARPEPELRVLATRPSLSALLVDGDARLLVINTTDRTTARAALGYLTRPWERGITTLVAPANDAVAPSLLEALARTRPNAVVIVGLPGADPVWSEIERLCAARGAALTYVAEESRTMTPRLALTFLAGTQPGDGAIIIQRGEVSVLFALGMEPVRAVGQLLVSNGQLDPANAVDAQLTGDPTAGIAQRVVVGSTTPTRVTIEATRLRVNTGDLLAPRLASPTTTKEGTP